MYLSLITDLMILLLSLLALYRVRKEAQAAREARENILTWAANEILTQKNVLQKQMQEQSEALYSEIARHEDYIHKLNKQVEEALTDMNPNFEAARKAMSQVNDMSVGLASLFNYDPMDALKRSREAGDRE